MTSYKYSAICSEILWLGFMMGSTLIKSGEPRSLHVKLPGYQKNLSVFPATSCPMNYSEYVAAATEQGCTLQDSVLTNKYHCMPNVNFTLLVQFCYPKISPPTQKSYCWVLSYSGIIDQRECNNFVDGCPVEHYRSFDMYKYPQCSNISTSDRCYVADAKCTPGDHSSTTNHRYFISDIQEYVTTDTATAEATEKSLEEPFSLVGVILGTLFGAMVFVVLACLIRHNRNRNRNENTLSNLTKQDYCNYLQEGKLTVNKVTQCQIVGEAGVGKTTLVYRLRKRFDARHEISPTRGCSYLENVLVFENGKLKDFKDSSKNKLLQTSVDTVQMFTASRKCLREGEVPGANFQPKQDHLKQPDKTGTQTSSKTATMQDTEQHMACVEVNEIQKSELTTGAPGPMKQDENKPTMSDEANRKTIAFKDNSDSFLKQDDSCSNENKMDQTPASSKARSDITDAENETAHVQESDPLLEIGESSTNRSHSNMDLEMANMSKIMHQEDPSLLSNLPKTKDEIPKVLSILDFAGQGGYYATHPIHLRTNAIFILVVNILHFNAKDRIRTKEEINEGHLLCDRPGTAYSKWSHEDFYLYWLRNIHYFCGKDVPVITVATHAENSTDMEKEMLFSHLREIAESENEKSHLDVLREFAIGILNSKECTGDIDKLEQCIFNLIEKEGTEEIPASRIRFEEIFKKIKAEDRYVISVSEVKQIASGMTENEILDMLQYFHEVGFIVFIPDNQLQDKIILDKQWLIDAFRYIITDKQHAKKDFAVLFKKYEDKWRDFKETGILPNVLLDIMWKDEKFLNHRSIIIHYMAKLGLVARYEDGLYIPCVNTRPCPDDNRMKEMKSDIASSIACFKFVFLPDVIYHSVIAACMDYKKLSLRKKSLFQTVAFFTYRDEGGDNSECEVAISTNRNIIAIQLIPLSSGVNLLQHIDNLIREIIKTTKVNLQPQIGYVCKNQNGYTDTTYNHVVTEADINARGDQQRWICQSCVETHQVDVSNLRSGWKKVRVLQLSYMTVK